MRGFDGETLKVRRTAHEGQILEGTKTDNGEQDAGRMAQSPRSSPGCSKPRPQRSRPRSPLHDPTGRMWRERNFYATSGGPPRKPSIGPHECRHSYVTHLRAAGINDTDLAEIAGHQVTTMLARYTHAVGVSFSQIRREIA